MDPPDGLTGWIIVHYPLSVQYRNGGIFVCKSIDWAFEVSKGLKPSSSLVLIDMARYSNHQTGICWPSRETLMQDTGLSMTAVREGLADIKKAGLIVETGEKVGRTGNVKKYRLTGSENGWVVSQTSMSNGAESALFNRAESGRNRAESEHNGAESALFNRAESGRNRADSEHNRAEIRPENP